MPNAKLGKTCADAAPAKNKQTISVRSFLFISFLDYLIFRGTATDKFYYSNGPLGGISGLHHPWYRPDM